MNINKDTLVEVTIGSEYSGNKAPHKGFKTG